MKIDLNTCKEGDRLLSCHGEILTYVGKTREEPFPHEIRYADGSAGSRSDDGQTYLNNKLPTDHDIVEILGE